MRDADGTAAEGVDDNADPVAAVGDALVMVAWSVDLLLLLAEKQLARYRNLPSLLLSLLLPCHGFLEIVCRDNRCCWNTFSSRGSRCCVSLLFLILIADLAPSIGC